MPTPPDHPHRRGISVSVYTELRKRVADLEYRCTLLETLVRKLIAVPATVECSVCAAKETVTYGRP